MIFFRQLTALLTLSFILLISATTLIAHEDMSLGKGKVDVTHEQGVESIEVLLSGNVSFHDTTQIRRLLRPWVEPSNIRFQDYIDEHGRRDFFTTVVQIGVERKNSPRLYKIIQQLRDQRFRGANAASKIRVLKTEVTVSGEMPTYANWNRSSLRNVPYWRNWRGDTSSVNHVLVTESDQKFVFHRNKTFDSLRLELGQSNNDISEEKNSLKTKKIVKMKAKLISFDGPYPVMSVQKFQIDRVNTTLTKKQETANRVIERKTENKVLPRESD